VKSILIVGGSGFLGSSLALRLRDEYKVWTTHFHHFQKIDRVNDLPLNLSQMDWVREMLVAIQPEVVIYVAGNHDQAWCENPNHGKEIEIAQVTGPTAVVASSQLLGSRMIYISSALVFDGSKGNYHETDVMLPSTVLGKSKVNGENSVRSRSMDYLILRTPPLLGRGPAHKPSMLDQWSWKWSQGKPVDLDYSAVHSYATMSRFCDWVAKCIESPLKNKTLHFGGLSRVTQYDLGCRLAERLKVPKGLVVRKPGPTGPPLDYSLNFTQSVKALETEPLFLKQSLDLLEKDLLISRT